MGLFDGGFGVALAAMDQVGVSPALALVLLETFLLAVVVVGVRGLVWLAEEPLRKGVPEDEQRLLNIAFDLTTPALVALVCWLLGPHLPVHMEGTLLRGAAVAAAMWLVLRVYHFLPGPKLLRRTFAVVSCLMVLGLSLDSLQPLMGALDHASFSVGGLTLYVRPLLQSIFMVGVLGWLAVVTTDGLAHVLEKGGRFSPALQTLLVKLFKIFGMILAVVAGLSVLGVNVTNLAVFGGALGVGIGLSLKSISSNIISGLVLLMDKSIKPGDVISLDDTTFGQVRALHSRYLVLRRRDGKEVLIPNETLMNQTVINWSYSNKAVRSEVEIPVSYGSDMEEVQALLLQAVPTVPRVLAVPKPVVFIKRFGDSAVIFLVRYWNNDPEMGVNNLRGDVNMACWKILTANKVEIPLPQRVVHMQT